MIFADRLHWLDLIRGLCALLVCAGHIRLALFVDYSELRNPSLWQTVFYIATGLSSQAVIVFFVLSGYLVGGSALKQGRQFRFGNYLTSRLVRLWIVLIPALVFTLIIDTFTLQTAPGMKDGEFFRRWTSGPANDGQYSTGIIAFLGNTAFLQTVVVPYYGSNGPLWSLACEFWYYMLFPALAQAVGLIGPRRHWFIRLTLAALCIGILAMLPKSMSWGFVIWLMGAAAAVVPMPRRRLQLAFGLACFSAALFASKLDHYGVSLPVPARFLIGAGFALLCRPLAGSAMPTAALKRFSAASAAISYSLYLIHFPVVIWIAVTWYADVELTATAADLVIFIGLMTAMTVLGVAFWLLFERHTERVRNWVRKRF